MFGPLLTSGTQLKRVQFNFLLVSYLLVGISCVLVSGASEADRGGYHIVEQGALWSSLPKARVFFALHTLLLAPLLWCIGLVGLFSLNRVARALPLAAALLLNIYYRLEPRYGPQDLPFLISIGGMAILGYLTVLISSPGARSDQAGDAGARGSWVAPVLFAGAFIASFALVRIGAQHLGLAQLVSFGVLVPSTFWFASGAIPAWTIHGAAAPLFGHGKKIDAVPESAVSKWRIIKLFLIFNSLLWAISGALLVRLGQGSLLWLAAAPIIPPVMSIYSPWSWFFSEGSSPLFVPELGLAGEARGRLFLGILFQYLVVCTIWLTVRAVIARRVDVRFVTALIIQLLYWAPTMWLFNLLGTMRPPQ